MLAVCMTLIDNDKDQTSFEDFYFRNRQYLYKTNMIEPFNLVKATKIQI